MKNLYDLLGTSFQCHRCDRVHTVSVQELVCGEAALAQLPGICAKYGAGERISLLADQRTYVAAGAQAADILRLAGLSVSSHIVPDPRPGAWPACDDTTRTAMERELGNFDLLLAVGSGVINDLAKWIAFERNTPYVVVATAASMNGYGSANVAPTIDGVKRLTYARAPLAIVTTPRILAAAPAEMTAAGLGDVLAKSVSSADWRLNQILFDDYYCPYCVDLQGDIEPFCLSHADGIASGSPEALGGLFDALTLTGILMTMAGTSAPASGAEHAISHTLDMMSTLDDRPHDLHGRQVGVGTIVAAALYQEVLQIEHPEPADPPVHVDRAFWGNLVRVVEQQYAKKRQRIVQTVRILKDDPAAWNELRQRLAPMLQNPAALKDALRRGKAAHRISDIHADRGRFLTAFLHAHEIRERYTVIDLARALGILPAKAEEIVDRWVVQ